MKKITTFLSLSILAGLSACAEVPDYSTVDIMPPPGKTWQQFSSEKQYCYSQAKEAVGHQVDRTNNKAIIGGAVTTLLGAGIGAAAGGGIGAGIGAASGAFAGTAGGGIYSGDRNSNIQSAYNTVYLQCMRTYGNGVSNINAVPLGYSSQVPAMGRYQEIPSGYSQMPVMGRQQYNGYGY